VTAPLLQFAQPPPLAPPGASVLLATILLAIHLAATPDDLAWWWVQHQPALKRLNPDERAIAVAAKDQAKGSA
jgi:hypothetical protein